MITAEGGIEREYIRVAPSTGAAAPGPGGLTARLLRMSKQTRSQTTKHGEPELSAPAIGGEDAAHTIHPRTHIAPVADRLIHLSPCSASILAAAHR